MMVMSIAGINPLSAREQAFQTVTRFWIPASAGMTIIYYCCLS